MNRIFKYLTIGVVFIIVCYAAYFIFAAILYSHSLDWDTTAKKYLYFFKDSIRDNLDSNISFSYTQKNDLYNHYIYKDIYYVTIWEFKNLKSIHLSNVSIVKNANLQDVKFNSGEILNKDYSPEITIKYGLDFDNTMNIYLNGESNLDSTFETKEYKGFYGAINRMLLSNDKGRPQILFDYNNEKQYGLFLFYKTNYSFYLLIINAKQPFDAKELIKIFNLP